jgi:hypothetical protein
LEYVCALFLGTEVVLAIGLNAESSDQPLHDGRNQAHRDTGLLERP